MKKYGVFVVWGKVSLRGEDPKGFGKNLHALPTKPLQQIQHAVTM